MTPSPSRSPAVLFDIDGTLIDSNYLHVHAWYRAFCEVGMPVEAWRIHRTIGMDGSALLESLTRNAGNQARQRAKDLHSRYYKETSALLRPLPGAHDVLRCVEELGMQVVLATSAPEDELSMLREVLGSEDLVSTVTSAEDVAMAKPSPDIVEVALHRAGVPANRAVFVGDTVWDARASARAGVSSIGVLSGGISQSELRTAGASVVVDNLRALTADIEMTPIWALAQDMGS
jgi:HAD superfamily hydrolase (TIGR01509 family)